MFFPTEKIKQTNKQRIIIKSMVELFVILAAMLRDEGLYSVNVTVCDSGFPP